MPTNARADKEAKSEAQSRLAVPQNHLQKVQESVRNATKQCSKLGEPRNRRRNHPTPQRLHMPTHTHQVDGKCIYGDRCRLSCLIYKLTCKCYGDHYTAKTLRTLNEHTQEHYRVLGRFYDKRNIFRMHLGLIQEDFLRQEEMEI